MFVGVDGEGGDIDGKHEYLLLRAGSNNADGAVLETGKPLNTYECLAFLADLPRDQRIYVSFAFDYDVTMIIRHLPPAKIARLFDRESRAVVDKEGKWTSAYYPLEVGQGQFEIDYLPHKEFKVRRKGDKKWTTINDTFTFFQSSFVNALRKFYCHKVGDDWVLNEDEPAVFGTMIDLIALGKEKRNEFTYVDENEREYNQIECDMLERLMHKFRQLCTSLDIHPGKWQGPGNLVQAIFKREGVPGKQFNFVDDEVWSHANEAYYGGRFEAAAYGEINQTVWQYDINSAYAASYKNLPCLRHATWERFDNVSNIRKCTRPGDIYFADVSFRHRKPARWYTLPVRNTKGNLVFSRIGRGWYWHPELEEANKHATLTVHRVYKLVSHCDCKYFDWVYRLYAERDKVGKDSGRGKVLKIVLATIYGKLAQSIGHPVYANPIWSGIVVSHCRATLINAALQVDGGADVLMLATDGMFCTRPRKLDIGKDLGQWTETKHNDMFIVMSGVYFLPNEKPKTRGVPQALIVQNEPLFRATWRAFVDSIQGPYDLYRIPCVDIHLRYFTSIRVANARGKSFLAGRWDKTKKEMKFAWNTKRIIEEDDFPGNVKSGTLWTEPPEGSPQNVSETTDRQIGGKQEYREFADDLFLEQCIMDGPDWADNLWEDPAYA